MDPVRTALASFGLSSQVFHGPFLVNNPGFSVVAVLERRTERSRALFPAAKIHRSFEALVGDPAVELVIVNTPDHLHSEMCEISLQAGKHVVVEKPMVPTAGRARELFELASRCGTTLCAYHNRRFDGDFMELQRLIASGALGRILEYESRFETWRPVDPAAWREQEETGGILPNLGSHLGDQAIALFGPPQWVQATTRMLRPGSKIADFMILELGYPHAQVILRASYQARLRDPRFTIRGTDASWTKWEMDGQEARLKTAAGYPTAGSAGSEYAITRTGDSGGVRTMVEAGDYGLYYRQLYAAIRDGAELPVSVRDAILTAELIEAAAESAHQGRRVRFPTGT